MKENKQPQFKKLPDIEHLWEDASPPLMRKRYSRRSLVKDATIGVGTLFAGYGIGQASMELFSDRTGPVNTFANELLPELTQREGVSKDPHIKEIEDKFGIRMITIFEAYDMVDTQFDEYNSSELNVLLPIRWDHDRAEMTSQLLPLLPSYFYKPDADGNRLHMTLTNYGTARNNTKIDTSGTFVREPEHLMLLDYYNYAPDLRDNSFRFLTHESLHRVQAMRDDTYGTLIDILGQPFQQFGEDTLAVIEQAPKDDIDLNFVIHKTRYGVANIDNNIRGKPNEFEASLSEVYLYGEEFFINNVQKLFGLDTSQKLYEYFRKDIFEGREYDYLNPKL